MFEGPIMREDDLQGKLKSEPGRAWEASSHREKPIEQGFTPWQLKIMGFLAVILTCGLVLYLFQNVSRLETQSARFLICLLVSLLLGIFFFVWWPKQYELERIPIINLPVRVAGPVVLWLAIFLLLLRVMPKEDAPYRPYSLVNPPSGKIQYHSEIKVIRDGGREADYELIEDRNRSGCLGKILIKFDPGEDEIRASLHIPLYRPLPVTFRRSESAIDVSKLDYSEE
jgi:hypothetical protein